MDLSRKEPVLEPVNPLSIGNRNRKKTKGSCPRMKYKIITL